MEHDNKITIGYWAIRGLAERIRQICQYCGIPYDQERYQGDVDGIDRAKWFNQVKPELIKKNPAVTLPYIVDGGKVVSESDAICVYLCHRGNKKQLLGRNSDEQVALFTALGVYKDMHPVYTGYVYGNYGQGTFDQALKNHRQFCKKMKGFLKKFNGMLGQNNYIGGNQLLWIDFVLAEFFQCLILLQSQLFENFPNLISYQKRVWALPELKNYFQSERFIQRPINNTIAKWK